MSYQRIALLSVVAAGPFLIGCMTGSSDTARMPNGPSAISPTMDDNAPIQAARAPEETPAQPPADASTQPPMEVMIQLKYGKPTSSEGEWRHELLLDTSHIASISLGQWQPVSFVTDGPATEAAPVDVILVSLNAEGIELLQQPGMIHAVSSRSVALTVGGVQVSTFFSQAPWDHASLPFHLGEGHEWVVRSLRQHPKWVSQDQ